MATTFKLKRKTFGIANVLTFGGAKNFQAMKTATTAGQKMSQFAKGAAKTTAAAGTLAAGTLAGTAALGGSLVD